MYKFIMMLLVGITVSFSVKAAEPYNPEGLWLTENQRSAIRVEKCDKGLCGRIAWIIEDGLQFDEHNPQENLRRQPMCGLEIMHSFTRSTSNPNDWSDGHIYKADEGDIYKANVTVK